MNFNQKLDYAFNLIIGYKAERFSKIYPFTTENINGYLSNYDLNGKSVLTVGSSGDQVINSYLMGASDVTLFDTNPLSKYFYDLKCAAIKALSYEEFLEYFCYLNYPKTFTKNKNSFNYLLYKKISLFLNGESKEFWDILYSNFSPLKIRKRLFSDDEYLSRVLKKTNLYMNEDNYNRLKQNILGFSPIFINADIRDVSDMLKDKYDFILLSNIACYIEKLYETKHIKRWRENIISLCNFLNEDGIMFMAYLYETKKDTKYQAGWDLIYNLNKVFEVFKSHNLSLESFVGVKGLIHENDIFKDSVLILKK